MISNAVCISKTNYKQPVLLWEQSSTSYAGGTLNFSGSYSMYIIEFTGLNLPQNIKMVIPLSSTSFRIGARFATDSSAATIYSRIFDYVRNNSIKIGVGRPFNSNYTTENRGAVPLKIWGISA